jgi:DNA-binding PadR family transcriptional regulator
MTAYAGACGPDFGGPFAMARMFRAAAMRAQYARAQHDGGESPWGRHPGAGRGRRPAPGFTSEQADPRGSDETGTPAFEIPAEFEEMARRMRAHMTGRGFGGPRGRGPWGGPGAAAWKAWGAGGPGHGWPFGPDGGSAPRARAGRGDVRTAILALLSEEPRHGYQIIQDITERSGGAWKPSPGSVYPALSALQDEGLVDDEKIEGRRVFALTEAGLAHVADRADELSHVFDANSAEAEADEVTDLRQLLFSVGAAAVQVVTSGSPEQVAGARKVLSQARRDLYLLLADNDDESESES